MYYALEKPYKEKGNPSEYDFFFFNFSFRGGMVM